MIEREFIIHNLVASDRNEVLKKLGNLLISKKIVKDGFVEALIQREIEFPTGLPVKFGVAIPHTDGVHIRENHLLFAKLEKSVPFNEMGGNEDDFVDVSIVIMMAIADGGQHLEILQMLIGAIQTEGFVKHLHEATSIQQMEKVIKAYIQIK